jgi:hypothetical protein
MATEILCEPAGYAVEGGKERIAQAIDRFTSATTEVANLVDSFLSTYDDDLPKLVVVIGLGEHDEYSDDLLELHDAISARRAAQEELLRAIAGAPEVK